MVAAVPPSAVAATKPVLTIGTTPEGVDSLDPALSYLAGMYDLLLASCTPLMETPAGRSGHVAAPVPAGAVGYPRVSTDGRTYTFTIRRGMRFSDGSAVTAANYARALGRVRDQAMQSPLRDVYAWDIGFATADGPRVLRIRLTQPNPDILSRLTLPFSCPVPLGTPIDPAGVDLTIGSGPYHVTSFDRSRGAVLRPNRFYRGPHPARFRAIVLKVESSVASLYRDAQAGRIDIVRPWLNADPAVAKDAVDRYGIGKKRLFYAQGDDLWYLAMNTKSPLFRNNVPLRRAVAFALDREEIIRQLDKFSARRTDQLLPYNFPGFVDHDLFPLGGPNLRFADRLAQGHLRGGRAVLFSLPGRGLRMAQVVEYNLKKIGLDVEIHVYSRPVLFAKIAAGEPYDLAGPLLWTSDYFDSFNTLGPFLSPSSSVNTSQFNDPAFDRRLRAAQRIREARTLPRTGATRGRPVAHPGARRAGWRLAGPAVRRAARRLYLQQDHRAAPRVRVPAAAGALGGRDPDASPTDRHRGRRRPNHDRPYPTEIASRDARHRPCRGCLATMPHRRRPRCRRHSRSPPYSRGHRRRQHQPSRHAFRREPLTKHQTALPAAATNRQPPTITACP